MEEGIPFVDYILSADLRFLYRRQLLLDLYYSGYLGLLVPCLIVASLTVFLLALFQAIPKRRHVIGVLLALGVAAGFAGLAGTYLNFSDLAEGRSEIIRQSAGDVPPPGSGQEAAVIALPLILGAVNLAGNVAGCLYLALFWGSSALPRRAGREEGG